MSVGRPNASGRIITGIVVSFNANVPAIQWADEKDSHTLMISADEKNAFVIDGGKHLSADEVSQKILEPLFFHKD